MPNPTFGRSGQHKATVPVGVLPAGTSFGVEVFLSQDDLSVAAAGGAVKAATSGVLPQTSTGSAQSIVTPYIVMPPTQGTYHVYVQCSVGLYLYTVQDQDVTISGGTEEMMTTGSYTGDGTNNKPIAHGLGRAPTLIFFQRATGGTKGKGAGGGFGFLNSANLVILLSGAQGVVIQDTTARNMGVLQPDSVNFYVGNGDLSIFTDPYIVTQNTPGGIYNWVAIG